MIRKWMTRFFLCDIARRFDVIDLLSRRNSGCMNITTQMSSDMWTGRTKQKSGQIYGEPIGNPFNEHEILFIRQANVSHANNLWKGKKIGEFCTKIVGDRDKLFKKLDQNRAQPKIQPEKNHEKLVITQQTLTAMNFSVFKIASGFLHNFIGSSRESHTQPRQAKRKTWYSHT